jgi:hypothetical protein
MKYKPENGMRKSMTSSSERYQRYMSGTQRFSTNSVSIGM